VARTAKTCRQCANHIPHIHRFSSFSWISSSDAQDLGGQLVNVLRSCITRDSRALRESEIGKSDRHWTNRRPASRMIKSAGLDRRRLSPRLEASYPRMEISFAELQRAWLRRMRPGFDAPSFRLSPRVILLTTPLGWLPWQSMGTA
jgi:hypothetical protein